jgi:hypothetical protein
LNLKLATRRRVFALNIYGDKCFHGELTLLMNPLGCDSLMASPFFIGNLAKRVEFMIHSRLIENDSGMSRFSWDATFHTNDHLACKVCEMGMLDRIDLAPGIRIPVEY